MQANGVVEECSLVWYMDVSLLYISKNTALMKMLLYSILYSLSAKNNNKHELSVIM